MSISLRVGDPAPEFRGESTEGRPLALEDFRGKYLVLYFYPKSFTPGCTRESRRFRDNYEDLKGLGAEVVGVSVDEVGVQCDFARENRLSFPLIADSDEAVSRAYGAMRMLVNRRITYVIDPQGVIAAIFQHEVQVLKHIDDVVNFLKGLRGHAATG